MTQAIERQALAAITHPYDHQPEDTAVTHVPLIDRIAGDLASAGVVITGDIHRILNRHLTTVNMLNHVAHVAQRAEQSPVVQALETAALGEAWESIIADQINALANGLVRLDHAAADEPEPAA